MKGPLLYLYGLSFYLRGAYLQFYGTLCCVNSVTSQKRMLHMYMIVYMCVYMHDCVHVYMYMSVCMCVYMHDCVHVCTCTCLCAYVYTCMIVCMCTCTCLCDGRYYSNTKLDKKETIACCIYFLLGIKWTGAEVLHVVTSDCLLSGTIDFTLFVCSTLC